MIEIQHPPVLILYEVYGSNGRCLLATTDGNAAVDLAQQHTDSILLSARWEPPHPVTRSGPQWFPRRRAREALP